jgi:protein AaeX
MLREISLGGALAPSLVLYVLAAIPLFVIVDRLSSAIGFYRLVWNPALVRLALFLCLLSGLVLITSPERLLP